MYFFNRKIFLIILSICFSGVRSFAQMESFSTVVAPRARVIIDNDFGGDPDGLFQLAHQLLSPSVEVEGIIGSHLYKGGFYDAPGTAAYACEQVKALLKAMALGKEPPVYAGAETSMSDLKTPVVSDGAKAIVREAMRGDTRLPLYVVCGAGLTDIASAYLMDPKIAKKIKLVWIGGRNIHRLHLRPIIKAWSTILV